MKVLVPVDKGPESQLALRYACHLLENLEADLDALYVKPDLVDMTSDGVYAPFHSAAGLEKTIEAEALQVGQKIRSVCNEWVSGKMECEPIMAVGEPSDEILHTAETGNYDLIVLGSHGRSSLRGFLLGTVGRLRRQMTLKAKRHVHDLLEKDQNPSDREDDHGPEKQ